MSSLMSKTRLYPIHFGVTWQSVSMQQELSEYLLNDCLAE